MWHFLDYFSTRWVTTAWNVEAQGCWPGCCNDRSENRLYCTWQLIIHQDNTKKKTERKWITVADLTCCFCFLKQPFPSVIGHYVFQKCEENNQHASNSDERFCDMMEKNRTVLKDFNKRSSTGLKILSLKLLSTFMECFYFHSSGRRKASIDLPTSEINRGKYICRLSVFWFCYLCFYGRKKYLDSHV